MRSSKAIGIVLGLAVCIALTQAAESLRPAMAQNNSAQDAPKDVKEPAKDYYQRSLEIYEFRKAAKSGTARGEEIFYYKCWFCHNEYVKDAVQLKGLYRHPRLILGQPVNDETVKAQIMNGGPGMAAYKYVLNDADLSDLVSYLREKCCWNSESVPTNPAYRATASATPRVQKGGTLLGGPTGIVRASNEPLEGMMVQLISQKTAIRTTVYSNEDGRYEFPKLEPGEYTLRIARPMEFYPFVKEGVKIGGADKLEDIALERITTPDSGYSAGDLNGRNMAAPASGALLPPYEEIAAQLTGSEWMLNMPGTGEQKKLLTTNCNYCHTYQQILRNRYDEAGWANIVNRMMHRSGSPLLNLNERGRIPKEDETKLVKWLASVRGPDSKDAPFVTLPRPTGRATRAIITEYELPRLELATHDVAGDSKGNIWYTPHRSSYIGRLDPRTGEVKEFHVPLPTNGALPGEHWIYVDRNDIVWMSETWARTIDRLDPSTGKITKVDWMPGDNSPSGPNYGLDYEGFIWQCRDSAVLKSDPNTGKLIQKFETKKFPVTYGGAISRDGKFYGGGAWPADGVVVADTKTGEVFEPSTSPTSGPARGEFDPQDNYWSGGRGGVLVEFDTTQHRVHEYKAPTPYVSFYTAMADKNGEIWAGELQGGRYARFNPKNKEWTEYVLPEPYAHDRQPWIDNSTNPVTIYYVDHDGWIVRIQPLD